MNILVINASPRGKRSNSYRLTGAFLEGLREEAEKRGRETRVTELCVKDLKIDSCLGCFSCWKNTPGQCCQKDDMERVLKLRLWADLTIWSFPLYYYNVPGPLKNLIDRQLPMVLPFMKEREDGVGSGSHPSRYDMTGKRTVLISTCGFYSARDNYDSVCGMFDHICGKGAYETIFCGQGELFAVPELSSRTEEYLAWVKRAGGEFMAGGIREETKERLEELLFAKETFEAMADASWGIDQESGERQEESLIFTKQMAALYRTDAWDGKDRVLEMYYTDLDKTYQILLGKEGSRICTDGSLKASTRIETPYTLWKEIAEGKVAGAQALAEHRYRVKGDLGLMMKWDDFFGGKTGREDSGKEETARGSEGILTGVQAPDQKPVMTSFLIPWIVFWAAVPAWPTEGGVAGIAACLFSSLLFFRRRRTIYDLLTGIGVAGLSLGILCGIPYRGAVVTSYLLFGLMWLLSCLGKIPLSASYSMYEYGGRQALHNPLFLSTNRILTAAWGVLYLFTGLWTFFLIRGGLGWGIGLINSVAPALMGVFTIWFQRFYPARMAAGKSR